MPRSEYSEYDFHVCHHMRLVVYTSNGEGEVGWYHVSKSGVLENSFYSEPCQASIHRVTMEWPVLALDTALIARRDLETGERFQPDPSYKTIAQRRVEAP